MKRGYWVLGVLTLFGCAQQVAPTGGPKDETPPKILSEVPENLNTNFNSKEIIVSFDEFIQLKNPAEQVLISPPLQKPVSYTLKKKSLVIKFNQELVPNTTYTLNFGEAIRDNNEGNILANYTYVFSTGAYLDSMEIKGKLTDAITQEPVKDALLMLYKNNIDSLPTDTMPDYFARTGEDGQYHIKNIGNQPYKIFALKDENANYRFDVPSEKIGFLDTLVTPFYIPKSVVADTGKVEKAESDTVFKKQESAPIPTYDLEMFVEEDTTQFLKKAYCEHFGKLVFVYNLPVNQLQANLTEFETKKQWKLLDYSSERDSITLWLTEEVPDTMTFLLTTERTSSDTAELYMKPRTDEVEVAGAKRGKGKKAQTQRFALTARSSNSKGISPKPDSPFTITWNHPIVATDLSRLKLYENAKRVKYDISSTDSALRRFDVFYPWKKDAKYRLIALDSSFSDIYGLWNDTTEFQFVGIDKSAFGELSLKVTEKPIIPYVVQILNSAALPIQEAVISEKQTYVFRGLTPGKFNVRVIRDLNNNGKWDSGRYSEKKQPEEIITIKQGAEVRANWNFELEWNPNTEN